MARMSGATLLLVAAMSVAAYGLPTSLISDAQEARTQAKRAEEVIMFGNQQNKPAEAFSLFSGVRKRAAPDFEGAAPTAPPAATEAPGAPEGNEELPEELKPRHLQSHALSTDDLLEEMRKEVAQQQDKGKTIAQYEKGYNYGVGKEALEKQAENSLLKTDVYGDPATNVNEYRFYGGGDARHSEHQFVPPNKRSVRYSPLDAGSRLKRDLELDPESLLALISLWQAQRGNHANHPSYRGDWGNSVYGYERQDENDVNGEGDSEGEEDANNGEWLDNPVPAPSRYFQYAHRAPTYPGPEYDDPMMTSYPSMKRSAASFYPSIQRYEPNRGGQWGGFTQDKRFMVSKKQQRDRWDEPMLARLLASQPRNPGLAVHRRLLL